MNLLLTINLLVFALLPLNTQLKDSSLQKTKSETLSLKQNDNQTLVLDIVEELYIELYESESGEISSKLSNKIQKAYKNKNTKNRDLLNDFLKYQEYINNIEILGKPIDPRYQLDYITKIESEFLKRYNKVPLLIIMYKIDALDVNDKITDARELINNYTNLYPDSTPLKFYKYIDTKDLLLKEDLLKKHKNHWMAKVYELN